MATLATNALTTKANLREATGRDFANAEELINAASDAVERVANRSFGKVTAFAEKVAGFGTTRLSLSHYPILSVTSITYDGGSIAIDDLEIDANAGLVQLPGGFQWTAHQIDDIAGTSWPGSERPLWEVTYAGGYVLPKDATGGDPRTLPWDLEQACIQVVQQLERVNQRDPTVKSEKLGAWSATYRDTTIAAGSMIPASAGGIIAGYTRVL